VGEAALARRTTGGWGRHGQRSREGGEVRGEAAGEVAVPGEGASEPGALDRLEEAGETAGREGLAEK
jgi:hypothetical protein